MANVSSSNGLKKYPKLRFPEFDEPYRKCQIGDIYVERGQRGAGDMELLSVTMNDGVMPRSEIEGKDNSSEDKSNYKVVRKDDMVYNSMRMWQGANGVSNYDGIVSPAYTVLMPIEEIDNRYFAALFKTSNLINEFRKKSQGLTSDTWNLKYPQIRPIRLYIPSLREQHKISAFIDALEERIGKQRQLVDALKKYKRGLLKDMFPQEDATVPKLRLAGFTSDWVQHNLGDLMNVTSVKRIHQSDWTNSGVRFLRARDIVAAAKNEKVSEPLFISQEKYNEYSEISGKVKKGDLLVTGVGTIGVPMLINSDEPLYFKDGNIIWFKNENIIDGKFFYYSFVSDGIQKFILESAGTGTVGTYTIDSGRKTPVYLPVQREEQIQIGKYFSQLDALIVLHQRKLDILMQCKNGIVQQLFI